MSLARDLLEQAQHLSRRERGRPRQASLRRAISAAYYALFHLLIQEATGSLVARPELRPRFARAFDHGDMRSASRGFVNPQPNQFSTSFSSFLAASSRRCSSRQRSRRNGR